MRERGIGPPSRRKLGVAALTAMAEADFDSVRLAPTVQASVIRVEMQRGNACVKLEWPIQSAEACDAWLRE